MDKSRIMFQRLDKIGHNGVLEKSSHSSMSLQVGSGHRMIIMSITDNDAPQADLQVLDIMCKAENCHNLGRGCNLKSILPWHSSRLSAQPVGNTTQLAVIHVHSSLPGNPFCIYSQFIALIDVVVQHSCQQVVCSSNGMEVASKMEVDVFHGHNLGITASRSASLHPEHRSQ